MTAAVVLWEERTQSLDYLEANIGHTADPSRLRGVALDPALRFCLAFAVELALKAALASQASAGEIQSGRRLPFGGHDLADLARRLSGAEFSAEDMSWFTQATAVVKDGKYPVPLHPRQEVRGLAPQPGLEEFAERAPTLFSCLMRLASGAAPTS